MPPKVITVVNQKGGPGKSTVSLHLAGALAAKDLAVLVLDTDPQGTNEMKAADADARSAKDLGESFPFQVTASTDNDFIRKLHSAAAYDFVVVDTPPSHTNPEFLDAICDVADLAVIPIAEVDYDSVMPIVRTVRSVLEPKNVPYRCVLNKVPPEHGAGTLVGHAESLDSAGLPRFAAHIRRYVAYQKAATARQLVSQYAYKNSDKATEDFAELATELIAHWDAYTAKEA